MYVREYFDNKSKPEALEMVNNIKDIFRKMLNDAEWMDDMTKKEAQRKLP